MKKRRQVSPVFGLVETSLTGHHCPKSGWWFVAQDPRDTRFICQGEVMPALSGAPALWSLSVTRGD